MKYILDFEQLNEAKQVGILYHYTNLYNLKNIIKHNFEFNSRFNGGKKPTISLTRNATGSFMITQGRTVRFTLDGDKLSEKYKLEPYADFKRGYGRKGYDNQNNESETILYSKSTKEHPSGEPINLKPYIKRIDIIYNDMFSDDFKDDVDFLNSVDLPIYVHKDTYDSRHENIIIQKNKSKFKDIKTIPKTTKVLPEAEELFKQLDDSSFVSNKDERTFIDGFGETKILHCGNIDFASTFKSIEDMANKLIKYKDKYDLSKYKCMYKNGRYIAYFNE